jgi:hypothetical protein
MRFGDCESGDGFRGVGVKHGTHFDRRPHGRTMAKPSVVIATTRPNAMKEIWLFRVPDSNPC